MKAVKSSNLDNEVMKASPWPHASSLEFCESPPNFQNLPAEFRFFVKNYNVLRILLIYVL
jgi:hypothetical protein